jgi:uncharacterized protein (DUF58 family)
VVREYEAEVNDDVWICLDVRGQPSDEAETLIEIAASLASYAAKEGRRFALVSDGRVITPASGPGHLELVLDFLARVEFRPDAPPLVPPPGALRPVLISTNGDAVGGRYSDVLAERLA